MSIAYHYYHTLLCHTRLCLPPPASSLLTVSLYNSMCIGGYALNGHSIRCGDGWSVLPISASVDGCSSVVVAAAGA